MSEGRLLDLVARFDRQLAWYRGGSRRYLVAEVRAPAELRGDAGEGPCVNLALVLDNSGSMRGERLAATKRAAQGIVDALTARDRLSVVSFCSSPTVHLDAVPMDGRGRSRATEAIRDLSAADTTNLSAGWMEGALCVAREMERTAGCQNRVVLLSDGNANQGICDPEELGYHAGQLRERGLYTSTVGIGEGYATAQLRALAEHGGGRLHDAETPEEIVEVVLGELGEIRQTVAENVEVTVGGDLSVRVKCLSDYPTRREPGRAVSWIGSLGQGDKRQVVFEVRMPQGKIAQRLSFSVAVSWRLPGSAEVLQVRCSDLALTFASGRDNTPQPRDAQASLLVAQVWQSAMARRIIQLNREGRYEEALSYFRRKWPLFEKYCSGLPGAEGLVREAVRLRQAADKPWEERARKEVEIFHYKRARGDRDYRSRSHGAWDAYIPDR